MCKKMFFFAICCCFCYYFIGNQQNEFQRSLFLFPELILLNVYVSIYLFIKQNKIHRKKNNANKYFSTLLSGQTPTKQKKICKQVQFVLFPQIRIT